MSRSLKFRKRTALITLGLMFAALLPLVFMQGTAEASCSAFTLHGTAHGNDGSALRRFDIGVFVHGRDHLLAHGRTSRRGGFSLRVCKTRRLATYARRHAHRVNFDLVAHAHHRRGPFHVRTVAVGYRSGRVRVSSHFVTAQTVSGTTSYGRTTSPAMASTMVPTTGMTEVAAYVLHPAVMQIEAVPHMQVDYDLSTNSVRNISAKVGVSNALYSAAGEMSIGGSISFGTGRTLRTKSGQSFIARVVKPTLSVWGQYTCYGYNPYVGWQVGRTGQCVGVSTGQWPGGVAVQKASYHSCGSGKAPVVYGTNHNTRYWKVGRGVVFSDSVSAGDTMGSVTVSTKYQTGTSVVYRLDQTRRKHRFCLGGSGRYVSTSPKLYISSADGGSSCSAPATDPSVIPCYAAKQD